MAWVTKDSVEQYDHTPEPPKEYTKKEKAQNWWHYHKFIVLGVVVAILVVAWFIKDTVFQTRPDVMARLWCRSTVTPWILTPRTTTPMPTARWRVSPG